MVAASFGSELRVTTPKLSATVCCQIRKSNNLFPAAAHYIWMTGFWGFFRFAVGARARNNAAGRTPNASAACQIVTIVGLRFPASSRQT
jgi:hypothetical protein